MSDPAYSFTGEVYLWQARADSWAFVDVPAEVSAEIRDGLTSPPRGFGSVRVEATVGGTTWRTSVFPDKQKAAYVLPLKRAVRRAEDLEPGDDATVLLRVLD